MKKKILLSILFSLIFICGCDSVYRYIFMPPEREEYMFIPDREMTLFFCDSTYRFSKDSLTIIMDKKDFKIEVKYMTDYQLNTFEFPEDSKGGFYSKNPYTYGDWIDPEKGFTPQRFTVFKITVYNYTSSKINIDPEEALLETDRGDKLNAYGREKKDARYQSIEEYFLKRKGSSGIDDDVFESRMGIVRRTMLTYGKPIYAGDYREGFIVFDPVDESVDKIKLTLRKFILGYNENNEPDKFANFSFYFKKTKLDKNWIAGVRTFDTTAVLKADTLKKAKEINIVQLQYTSSESRYQALETWNPFPEAIPDLVRYVNSKGTANCQFSRATVDALDVNKTNLVILIGGYGKPDVSSVMFDKLARIIQNGGLVYFDNSFVTNDWPYYQTMLDITTQISNRLQGKSEIKRISIDHPIFKSPNIFYQLPKGYDDVNPKVGKNDVIDGLFVDGKLVAIISNKGYVALWHEKTESTEALNFGQNLIQYVSERKK